MYGRVQRERRARRKGDGNKTDSEDTEPEEESKGEINNSQDLQLGSTMPVVRHEAFNLPRPPHLTNFLQDMDQSFVF